MGIILGALGGAGDALEKVGARNQEASIKQDQMTLESNLAQQRAESLALFNNKLTVDTANQQRDAQAARIGTAAQPILDAGIIGKATAARGNQLPAYDPDADATPSFHGDATKTLAAINALPDGPDKTAALAQLQSNVSTNRGIVGKLSMSDLTDDEKTKYAPSADEVIRARDKAARLTGDITPAESAKLDQGAQLGQAKLDTWLQVQGVKSDAAKEIAAARQEAYEARTQAQYDAGMAKLQIALDKASRGDPAMTRMLITSEDANMHSSTSQLGTVNRALSDGTVTPKTRDGKENPAYTDLIAERDRLRSNISASMQIKLGLFKSLGIVGDDTGAPTPPAAPPPTPPVAPTGTPGRPPLSQFLK